MVIHIGANCKVGSSKLIFTTLTEILMETLSSMCKNDGTTVREIDSIIEPIYLNSRIFSPREE